MKQILFLAFTGIALAASAQTPKEPAKPAAQDAKPAAKEPAKPAPMKEAAKPEPMKQAAKPAPAKEAAKPEPVKEAAATPRKPRRWNEDARHCLERPTNTEVIKCAEEYL